ncbi:universal stress protein [Streptomyces gossypiisoli]
MFVLGPRRLEPVESHFLGDVGMQVGVDGSGRSLRALVWATQEAALRRCPLRIIHVVPPAHEYATTAEGRAWEESQRDQGIVAEATAIALDAHPDLDVTSAVPSGAPAPVLLAEAEHAHTVVLGAKGRGGFGSLLLGSVALQVVGHAASPVVIVNHITIGHRRIVVGVDGSEYSDAALAYAFQQASLRGAQLQALHAWSPPVPHAVVSAAQDAMAKEHQQALEEWLAPLREEYPDVDVVEQLPDDPRSSRWPAPPTGPISWLSAPVDAAASAAWPSAPSAITSCSSPCAPWQSFAHAPRPPLSDGRSVGFLRVAGAGVPVTARRSPRTSTSPR